MIYFWYVLWAHKGVQGPSWFFSLNKWNNQVLLLLERLPRSVLVICPGEDVSPSCTFLDAWSAELGRNFVVCVYLVYVDNSEIVLWLVEFLEHVLWNFWFLYLASHFVTWNQEDKEVVLNGVVQLYKVFNFGNTWHILGGFCRFCSTISHLGCERIVVCHIL